MAEVARVHNLEALKRLKHALWKFQEIAMVSLTDAESDMQRTGIWLETEQKTYWTAQLRKRQEAVEKAKEKVREKQLYKDATGMRSSAVDEMKILQAAQRSLVEAEQKVVAIRKFIPKMQKETMIYRGGVQRFASTIHTDLPVAIDKLDRLLATLEAYVSLSAGSPPDMATSTAELFGRGAGGAPSGGMTRATGGEPAPAAAAAPAPAPPEKPANFPRIEPPQVALIHVEQLTGDPRSPDGSPITGEPSYTVFETADDARRYAYDKVQADPLLQCNIHDAQGHLLHLVKADDPPPPAKPYDGAV
jgi:hypothetical protein